MKEKKILIVALIIVIVFSILFGIYNVLRSYGITTREDGSVYIYDGTNDLIEMIRGTEDKEERKKQIEFSIEHGTFTKEEADELFDYSNL